MSKTATKKAKGNELATKIDVNNMNNLSFENIFNMDEKELNRQMTYDQKKIGKRSQLQAKIIDATNMYAKCEQRFKLSLIDPTVDSVELMIQMECFNKEKEIAYKILHQLFPEEFTEPLN